MTEEILEILYKRLLMTIEQAPTPKLSAVTNWPARGRLSANKRTQAKKD